MDDELEDEVLYQTVLSHVKMMSRFLLSFPLNSTSIACFSRFICFYLLKPETIVVGVGLFVVFLLCHSTDLLWMKGDLSRSRLARLREKARNISNFDQQWELMKDNAAIFALKGTRPRMEDRFRVLSDEASGIYLYGIFDGHGGESAAEFAEKNLFEQLLKRLQDAKSHAETSKNDTDDEEETTNGKILNNKTNGKSSLTQVFSQLLTQEILAVDSLLLSKAKASHDVAGTTALVAIIHGNQLIVANVGDSRGVICDGKGTAIPLSFDHKPQQLKEHKRIKEAGGFITFNGVWRVAGILATSRALGDFPLKDRNLVIAEPDILTFNLDDLNPQFMILATDGLWDAFTNEEAVSYIKEHFNETHYGAKSIALQACYRGSVDNVTVLIVDFQNFTVDRVNISKE